MTGAVVQPLPAVVPKPPLQAGGALSAIVPQSAEQAWRMAEMIHRSGLAPRDMNRPEQIVVAIFHGLEIGMKPMQSVQSIAVVNGRPTIWGDAAIGLVQASGLLIDFAEIIEGEGDKMVAVCRAVRVDRATPIERRFSVSDARTAGLWDKSGPWKQYPKRMLQMRARSLALRDGFADVLKGMQLTEEVHDYQTTASMPAASATVTGAALLAQATAPADPPQTEEPAEVTHAEAAQ